MSEAKGIRLEIESKDVSVQLGQEEVAFIYQALLKSRQLKSTPTLGSQSESWDKEHRDKQLYESQNITKEHKISHYINEEILIKDLNLSKAEKPWIEASRRAPQPPPPLSESARELLALAAEAGVLDGAEPTIESLAPGRLEEMLAALKELDREQLMHRQGFIDEDPQICVSYKLSSFSRQELDRLSEQALRLLLSGLDGQQLRGEGTQELNRGRQLNRDGCLAVKDEVVEPAGLQDQIQRAINRAVRRRVGARSRLSLLAG